MSFELCTLASVSEIIEIIYIFFNFLNSFYPLYPQSEDVPLDFSIAPEALDISIVPDILILPSDVKYFVKVNA